jgi:hypothetical protein
MFVPAIDNFPAQERIFFLSGNNCVSILYTLSQFDNDIVSVRYNQKLNLDFLTLGQ